MKSTSRIKLIILALSIAFSMQSFGQEVAKNKAPQTIQELKAAIEEVMKETKMPAVGIALVNADGPVWIASLGKANIEKNIDATDQTLFRIGSTSKMFVSLAILKLQEEGRLSLKDKVQDLVPEIKFTNKWEETNPVLVENLLEHTTGWDDMHEIEYAHNDPTPISLKDGLDFHPQSRVSRWMPGTRMAYCNSGPAVAAYIVEKITGKKYEDYIQENFFNPMGMKSATFFRNENYKKHGVTTYQGGKPDKYNNIITRPSGSINDNPTDMAKMLEFFIHRGKADSLQLISEESLKRMETCMTTNGAKAGMELGYGLSNYSAPYKSFIYRTHDGSVGGALSGFGYIPESGVGYSVLVNSDSYGFERILDLVWAFQTKDLPNKKINANTKSSEGLKDISGYYIPLNTRTKNLYFLHRILGIFHVWQANDTVFSKRLFGSEVKKTIAVSATRYESSETGKISMVKAVDPLDGNVVALFDISMGGELILKRISTFLLFIQFVALALWVLLMLVSVVYGVVWVTRYWLGKIKGGANIKVRLWPLISSLLVLLIFFLFITGMSSPHEYFGKPSFVSISFMLATIGYAIASVWSVVYLIIARNARMNKIIYWYSATLSFLHLLITFYLLWYGVIGMQAWS